MSNVYRRILDKVRAAQPQFVVLVDPEKSSVSWLRELVFESEVADVDMYFVGGSTFQGSADDIVKFIKKHTSKAVVLFPGNINQISQSVDAVLFLSLISGRNPEFLIDSHVKAVPLLGDVEVISVGYILVDGGFVSSTQRVTSTQPMSIENLQAIVDTARASELLGHKMIYLEAGSGALNPVSAELISAVKSVLNVPLIVGGGIRDRNQLSAAYDAGADIVVVGNAFEKDFTLLRQ